MRAKVQEAEGMALRVAVVCRRTTSLPANSSAGGSSSVWTLANATIRHDDTRRRRREPGARALHICGIWFGRWTV